jgi:hypothetical protein
MYGGMKMKEMNQEISIISLTAALLVLLCVIALPGVGARNAEATTLVNLNDVRVLEASIPEIQGRLRRERGEIRQNLRRRIGTPEQRRVWRARKAEIERRLRELKRELREARRCRLALEYAEARGFPYPEIIPGETAGELDQRLGDYIRSTLFRIQNLTRAIESAAEVGPQADALRRRLIRRRKHLQELLRKARSDRRKVQNGEIVIPPAPQNNGGQNNPGGGGNNENQQAGENENVEYFPGEGYFVTLAEDQLRLPFDSEAPMYVVQNPFESALRVEVEITDGDSSSLAFISFALPGGGAMDVSSVVDQLSSEDRPAFIYFLTYE